MTAVITADPKQLVEAYKQGDAEAFDEIVRCYYEGLFTHALRRLGDAHAAEDAVQETLVRAYGALQRFNGQYHLRAWLHRILSNVCHDEGARRQREARTVERVAGTEVDLAGELDDDEVLERLAIPRLQVLDALSALSEPYRRALVLRYVDELSFREVAEATGVTEGNARARVHRARAALRRSLGATLALLAWLVPVLRRAERTAAADGGSSVQATVAASHATPVLSRAVDAGLAERVASLAGSLGVAASLAVPVGVSQVADQVKPPPPPVVELQTAAEPVGAPAAASSPSHRPPLTTRTTLRGADTASTQAPATTTAPAGPQAGSAGQAAKPGLLSPAGGTRTDSAGSSEGATGAPTSPAPPKAITRFVVESDELTATTSWRTDLAGRVKVRIGDRTVSGNLVGVLEAARREPAGENAGGAEGENDDGAGSAEETGSTSTSASERSTTTTTAPPQPRRFTADLTVRVDDGRVVRLRMTGTLTDADGGVQAAGETTVFDELCGVELGTARLSGPITLREAPLLSSLGLDFDGVALADAATSRTGCSSAKSAEADSSGATAAGTADVSA